MVEANPQHEAKLSRDEVRDVEWHDLLETALTMPGDTMGVYNRFHRYSMPNQLLLYMQGATGPVASYQRWLDLGRQVRKGERGMAIRRPINVKVGEDDNGDDVRLTRFKLVNGAFQYSQTDGEDIPMPEVPDWSLDRMLGNLGITRVAFESIDGNTQGYSRGTELAVSPIAAYPLKTALHEASHIEHGHTTPENLAKYQEHRGTFEFEAEGSAYLSLSELDMMTDDQASVSRGYLQGWLGNERPSDSSIRAVFRVADKLVRSGYAEAAIGEAL